MADFNEEEKLGEEKSPSHEGQDGIDQQGSPSKEEKPSTCEILQNQDEEEEGEAPQHTELSNNNENDENYVNNNNNNESDAGTAFHTEQHHPQDLGSETSYEVGSSLISMSQGSENPHRDSLPSNVLIVDPSLVSTDDSSHLRESSTDEPLLPTNPITIIRNESQSESVGDQSSIHESEIDLTQTPEASRNPSRTPTPTLGYAAGHLPSRHSRQSSVDLPKGSSLFLPAEDKTNSSEFQGNNAVESQENLFRPSGDLLQVDSVLSPLRSTHAVPNVYQESVLSSIPSEMLMPTLNEASGEGLTKDLPLSVPEEEVFLNESSPNMELINLEEDEKREAADALSSLPKEEKTFTTNELYALWPVSLETKKILSGRQYRESRDMTNLEGPSLFVQNLEIDLRAELLSRMGKPVPKPLPGSTLQGAGLLEGLLEEGHWRQAFLHTSEILVAHGQAPSTTTDVPLIHTQKSLQVWLCRVTILMQLGMYKDAMMELESFGDFERPDLLYQYYPKLYPNIFGSMVPFSLRLVHAELPIYTGQHPVAVDRLSSLLSVCRSTLAAITGRNSSSIFGVELKEELYSTLESIWRERTTRVLLVLSNALTMGNEFGTVLALLQQTPFFDESAVLQCAFGRVCLHCGDLPSAERAFGMARSLLGKEKDARVDTSVVINRALLHVAKNEFEAAKQLLLPLVLSSPDNSIAVNNLAICMLYTGKLGEAIHLLEESIKKNPFVSESLVFNLCSLYDLESSRSIEKKRVLLTSLSQSIDAVRLEKLRNHFAALLK